MSSSFISYQNTGTLPALVQELMDMNPLLEPFYKAPPTLDHFGSQMTAKTANYPEQHRIILAERLHAQYNHLKPNSSIKAQIDALKQANTFTVTTGHQLNLMGGPLFFLYKIISVINLANTLKANYPNSNVVPVFWMASEDHDFEEISHFYFKEHRLEWHRLSNGPVGRLSTSELQTVFNQFSKQLGTTAYSNDLKIMFETAYLKSNNLADATRALVHQIFGDDGLLVIDGDDADLKRLFVPTLSDELSNKVVFNQVNTTNKALKSIHKSFKIQVNPRPINLFYTTDNSRARIEEKYGIFRVLDTNLKWDLKGILKELETHPDRFSPNVLMRPLYQETILPNLCYVGGGGELSYWLQLKSTFDCWNITFPLLLHRNSALIISKKQEENLEKLQLTTADLFASRDKLAITLIGSQPQLIDFTQQKNHIKQQFKALYSVAKQTDASFLGAVSAQEQKQINGLMNLEKRLLKAEKRKHKTQIDKALALQSMLFPEGNLQERQINFSTFYAHYGQSFIETLKLELDPFQQGFTTISL